jgi:hypothetical protein
LLNSHLVETPTVTDVQDKIQAVEQGARRVTAQVGPWIVLLARTGYAAKGVTYVLMGGLAMLAAFSYAVGRTAGSTGATLSLLDQPWGWAVVTLIAVGFLGYAVWCFVLAIADPERRGRTWRGLRSRLANLAKAVVHVGLAAVAVGALVGVVHSSAQRDPIEQWTARLMSLPAGMWLTAVAGACVLWAGGFQLHRSWRPRRLDDQLRIWHLRDGVGRTVVLLGRAGVAARGLIFLLMGAFLLAAAYHADPSQAKGVGRALRFIQDQWEGRYLLALVSLGLVAYGLFQFVLARYRRVEPA